jgi:hypothetical protein
LQARQDNKKRCDGDGLITREGQCPSSTSAIAGGQSLDLKVDLLQKQITSNFEYNESKFGLMEKEEEE